MDEQEQRRQLADGVSAMVVERMRNFQPLADGLIDFMAKLDPDDNDYWRGWSEGYKTAIDAFTAGIRQAAENYK